MKSLNSNDIFVNHYPKEVTRTPIKGNVRRQAGQSAREWLNEFVDDEALLAVIPLFFMLWWLIIELSHRYSKHLTPLWLIGSFLVLSVANLLYRIRRIRSKAKQMKQGIFGERYVAQIIDRDLVPKGYKVFHDIVINKDKRQFNIDHLLIGPNGVFSIETKTWSKPIRGETLATFDGEFISLNDKVRQPNTIGQANALAKEASELIKKQTGLTINVIPVVVVVGWYVRKTCSGFPKVLVVNEEAMAAFIQNVQGTISERDIALIVEKITEENKAH